MASLSFTTKKKDACDDYFTSKEIWESINKYIPKDKTIWEPFYHKDSPSPSALRELNCKEVICKYEDFFKTNYANVVIVSNPPFSCKKKVFERLKELNHPFILILPVSTITKAFFRRTGFADEVGIIVSSKRMHFIKGSHQTTRCWYDTIFVCFQIEGVNPREIVYL